MRAHPSYSQIGTTYSVNEWAMAGLWFASALLGVNVFTSGLQTIMATSNSLTWMFLSTVSSCVQPMLKT